MKRVSRTPMVEIAILLVGYAAAVLFGFIGARQAGYTMWQSLKGGVQAPWVFLWWPVPLLLFVSAPLVLLSLAPISRRRWWFGLRRGILVLLAALWVLLCWGRMTALKQQGSPTTGCSRISNSASAV